MPQSLNFRTMNFSTLDSATVQLIAWVSCLALVSIIGWAGNRFVNLISLLTKNDIQNQLRLQNLEENVDTLNDEVFPGKKQKRK